MKPDEPVPSRSSHGGLFGRYAQSLYQLLSNRRKFERVPATGTILVTYGSVVPTTQTCSCVDVSPRGIAIDSPVALEPNTFVALRSNEQDPKRWARVRYCRPVDELHRIGLEFVASDVHSQIGSQSGWSQNDF